MLKCGWLVFFFKAFGFVGFVGFGGFVVCVVVCEEGLI